MKAPRIDRHHLLPVRRGVGTVRPPSNYDILLGEGPGAGARGLLPVTLLGHDVHRVRAPDELPVEGVTCQEGFGAVLVEVQFLGFKVE